MHKHQHQQSSTMCTSSLR